MDRYFYIIEQKYHKKVIHIQGNIYVRDDGKYNHAEWTFLYMEIPEAKIESGSFFEDINERVSYMDDISEDIAIARVENYFDGEPGIELHISNITENTPCGCYWFDRQ